MAKLYRIFHICSSQYVYINDNQVIATFTEEAAENWFTAVIGNSDIAWCECNIPIGNPKVRDEFELHEVAESKPNSNEQMSIVHHVKEEMRD
jgi:hypothetical protein